MNRIQDEMVVHLESTDEDLGRDLSTKDRNLWEEYRGHPDSTDLRHKLILRYLHLVRFNAERIAARLPTSRHMGKEDLQSAGIFGLMEAIEAFDLSCGVKFETYCVPRIRGAMLDELRETDWVPRLVRSQTSTLAEATKELDTRLGRKPISSEIAAHMNVPREMAYGKNVINVSSRFP